MLNLNGVYCLKFWYWRHFSQNNRIDVFTVDYQTSRATLLWTSSVDFPNKIWHMSYVSLRPFNSRIVIRATHLGILNAIKRIKIKIKFQFQASTVSPVDLDDIQITTGVCQPPINCDFNDDMCGWVRDWNYDWIWELGLGRVEKAQYLNITNECPPLSRLDDNGMYMFTDYTQKNSSFNSTMVMNSEYVGSTSSSCLKFYYIPLLFAHAKFSINLIDTSGELDNIFNFLLILFKFQPR